MANLALAIHAALEPLFPYREMMAEANALTAIEAATGHTFADRALLRLALTHVSALKAQDRRSASYQRLEFLGDHVLGFVVSAMLYRTFPDAEEGELSRRLADLVRKETCADVGLQIGLQDAIRVGGVSGRTAEKLRLSVLGDICEALIGAIYIDAGHDAVEAFIQRFWTPRLDKPANSLRDPKTMLQEWAQGQGLPPPSYQEMARSGPHHRPEFRVRVEVRGVAPADGVGASKRAAEKIAAHEMLIREGVISDE